MFIAEWKIHLLNLKLNTKIFNYSIELRAGITFVVPCASEHYGHLLRSKFAGFVCGVF